MIEIALKALILKKNEVLVIKRSRKEDVFPGLWDIPGGKLRFGETPEEGLKREVKEETSIDIEVLFPLSVWSFFRNETTQVIGITFLCFPKSKRIKLGKEHVNYKWISLDKVERLKMDENLKKEIKMFCSFFNFLD